MKTLKNGLYCWKHDRGSIFILTGDWYTYIKGGVSWDARLLDRDRVIRISVKHYYEKV